MFSLNVSKVVFLQPSFFCVKIIKLNYFWNMLGIVKFWIFEHLTCQWNLLVDHRFFCRRFHLSRRDSKGQGCKFIFHNYIQLLKNIFHGLVGQRKVRCHVILFVKLKVHTFEVVWTQNPLIGRLYFLTYEIVCISLIEMNVILVVVDIQDIHENKNMT
jgi:hypothetical protein